MTADNEKRRFRVKSSPAVIATISVAVTLTLVATTAYFLNYQRVSSHGQKVEQSSASTADGKGKPLYWRSAMNPTEVYKQPGKDRMGMELVPVKEGEEPSGPSGTVKIDPVTIQNIGVKTVVVERKKLSQDIRTVGRVAYNEKNMRQITLKIGGWVEHQYVNFTGQEVKQGDPLLEIYSPDLVSTEEEYLLALRYRRQMKKSVNPKVAASGESLLKAAEARLRYWDITDDQIKTLRESGSITRTTTLHAPFRGIITERSSLEGGYVQPGQTLYHIADISNVWVVADIYEYEVPWLKVGQDGEMTLAYEPGTAYRGKVTYVYPYVKDKTRTLQVRLEFKNSQDFKLKPDMWADVTLKSGVSRDGLTVPIQSVIRTGTKDIALLALDGGRFEPRELRLGAQAGEDYEILKGLQEGDRVVTSAQFLINSESNLQSALSKMLEPKKDEGVAPAPPTQLAGTVAGAAAPLSPSSKPSPAVSPSPGSGKE